MIQNYEKTIILWNRPKPISFLQNFHISIFQMCLLLLFNMRETMTYEEIKDESSIPDRELTRALQPLAIGKASQRILIKNPKTKEIEPSHTFQVNDAFTSQLYRIKVQQASARLGETEPERNETIQVTMICIFIFIS